MAGITNRGALRFVEMALRNTYNSTTAPTNFYLALVTSAAAPTVDTNLMSELTEIAAGNGYTTGGVAFARSAAGWPTLDESDVSDFGLATAVDAIWIATAGALPPSGSGARYAVLTHDAGVVSAREVLGWVDLVSDWTTANGEQFAVQAFGVKLRTAA